MGVRPPAVAGQFYESAPEALEQSLRDCFQHRLGPGSTPEPQPAGSPRVLAIVSPHAGYLYSGPAAAHGFAALAADGVPDTVVILGPSHSAAGRRAALSAAEAWDTPLGRAALDVDLREELLRDVPELVEVDERAHAREHSLEVQVPFLQFVYRGRLPKLLPLCLRRHAFHGLAEAVRHAESLGQALARLAGDRRLVAIASTDLSHHLSQQVAERQDRLALEQIERMSPEGLLRTVIEQDISMCGPVGVAAALWFAQEGGKVEVELLRYYTSGDITGERTAVVGYASLAIRRGGGKGP